MLLTESCQSPESSPDVNWGACPDKDEIQQWMLFTSGEKIELHDEQESLSPSPMDSSSLLPSLPAGTDFFSSSELQMDLPSAFKEDSMDEFLHPTSADSSSPPKEDNITACSPSPRVMMEEYRQAKIADRRKRNRESSARCYYRRKRKEAVLKAEWDRYRHRVLLLQYRRNELLRENALLRMKVAEKNVRVMSGLIPQELITFLT